MANIIYLDQPVGTGFSYGHPLLTKMEDGSREFLNFMLAFYDKYPEFKARPFFITGESYAGKYIPLFARDILRYNSKQNDTGFKIPLKSLLIGNPLNSPPI